MIIKNYPNNFLKNDTKDNQKFVHVGSNAFSDVNKSDWFEPAVNYGAEKGYIAGFPIESGEVKPKFKPQDFATRAQTAAFLYAFDHNRLIPAEQKIKVLEEKNAELEKRIVKLEKS